MKQRGRRILTIFHSLLKNASSLWCFFGFMTLPKTCICASHSFVFHICPPNYIKVRIQKSSTNNNFFVLQEIQRERKEKNRKYYHENRAVSQNFKFKWIINFFFLGNAYCCFGFQVLILFLLLLLLINTHLPIKHITQKFFLTLVKDCLTKFKVLMDYILFFLREQVLLFWIKFFFYW